MSKKKISTRRIQLIAAAKIPFSETKWKRQASQGKELKNMRVAVKTEGYGQGIPTTMTDRSIPQAVRAGRIRKVRYTLLCHNSKKLFETEGSFQRVATLTYSLKLVY